MTANIPPEMLFALSDMHRPDSIPILSKTVAATCGHMPFLTAFHCRSWKLGQRSEGLQCSCIAAPTGLPHSEPAAWQDGWK